MSENIPYIIAENGYYYVAYKEKVKVPEIVVSAKGVANGLSEEYNDGWDFGPDSYSPTSTSAIPYTQTSGVTEAINYALATGEVLGVHLHTIPIRIIGNIVLKASSTFTSPYSVNNLEIYMDGDVGGNTICEFNSGYAWTFDPTAFASTTFIFHSVNAAPGSGYTPAGFFYLDTPNTAVTWISYYLQLFSGWTESGMYLNGFYSAYFYENQLASISSPTQNSIYLLNGKDVGFFGGSNYGNAVSTVHNLFSYSSTFLAGNSGISDVTISAVFVGGSVYIDRLSGTFGVVAIVAVKSAGAAPFCALSGSTTMKSFIVDGFYENNGTTTINFELINNPSSESLSIDNIQVRGIATDDGVLEIGYTLTPSLPANPPVSGTVYQNTNPYGIEIDLPVYATTSATAGYVTVAKGTTDTPTAIGSQYVSGDTSDTSEQIIRLRVPAGWYYEFTASGVTFGTASVFAE